jgi:hypothetical protein
MTMAPRTVSQGHGAPSHPVHTGSRRLLGACAASWGAATPRAHRSSADIPRPVSPASRTARSYAASCSRISPVTRSKATAGVVRRRGDGYVQHGNPASSLRDVLAMAGHQPNGAVCHARTYRVVRPRKIAAVGTCSRTSARGEAARQVSCKCDTYRAQAQPGDGDMGHTCKRCACNS